MVSAAQMVPGERAVLERVLARNSMLLPLEAKDPNLLEPRLDVEETMDVVQASNSDSCVDQALK
jgi:hypothetical protein